MEEWVKDLGEQNAMLVRTVEELEREASNRVILLEEKLQQSAATVANMGEDGVRKLLLVCWFWFSTRRCTFCLVLFSR